MNIDSISDLRKAFRNGPCAWPGGYPCYFVMSDGEPISFSAAKEERRMLLEALVAMDDSGWRPVAFEVNWEDPGLFCTHSGERIESAYAEDEAKRMAQKLRDVVTRVAPSHWASYLINGDASGLEESELASCNAWLNAEGLGMPVSCDDAGFRWTHDASKFCLACDCQEYVFLIEA